MGHCGSHGCFTCGREARTVGPKQTTDAVSDPCADVAAAGTAGASKAQHASDVADQAALSLREQEAGDFLQQGFDDCLDLHSEGLLEDLVHDPVPELLGTVLVLAEHHVKEPGGDFLGLLGVEGLVGNLLGFFLDALAGLDQADAFRIELCVDLLAAFGTQRTGVLQSLLQVDDLLDFRGVTLGGLLGFLHHEAFTLRHVQRLSSQLGFLGIQFSQAFLLQLLGVQRLQVFLGGCDLLRPRLRLGVVLLKGECTLFQALLHVDQSLLQLVLVVGCLGLALGNRAQTVGQSRVILDQLGRELGGNLCLGVSRFRFGETTLSQQ